MNLPGWESEVDDCDFCGNLWGVVRVGKFGCDVKLEVIMVGNNGVSQLDHSAAWLFESLKEGDR